MNEELKEIIKEIDNRVLRLSHHADKCKGVESKQYEASATTLVLLKMWVIEKFNN